MNTVAGSFGWRDYAVLIARLIFTGVFIMAASSKLDLSIDGTTDIGLDRDCTTLSRHVLQQLQSFSPEAQDLSALMNRIALAGKLIARGLSRAGLHLHDDCWLQLRSVHPEVGARTEEWL